jgi:putative Holliday junction resolvase
MPKLAGHTAEAPAARLVLAFDFGHRRGVPAAAGEPRWEVIDALMREWQPALLVVGLPYNVDGSDSGMTRDARAFAAALAQRYPLEVQMTDERYSSTEAEGMLKAARESGLRRRRVVKADVDAAAACVILERWFSEEETAVHAFAAR